MRLRKWLISVVVCLLSLSLTGCSGLELSPESLMRPPIFTEEQTEIYQAAKEFIGSDVILCYPDLEGVHSSFVGQDFDGDGEEEMLVFYQTSLQENVRINLLDKRDNVWRSVCDIQGAGTEVLSLDFTSLRSPDRMELVAEWSNLAGSEKTLTVLSMDDGRLETIFSYDFASRAVTDLNRDGIEELILLTGNSELHQSSALLVKSDEEGTLSVASVCSMSPDIYSYASLQNTLTVNGEAALLVDGRLSDGAMVTEVIAVGEDGLENLVYSPDHGSSQLYNTYRNSEILSKDIDYDGILEIPSLSLMPSTGDSSAMEEIYMQNWMKLTDNGFEMVLSAVINETYGYYVAFPDRWLDSVTVIAENPGCWCFCDYNYSGGWNEVTPLNELLRIVVYSKTDYHDDFDTAGMQLIYETSEYEYYASIGYSEGDLAITYEELTEMFIPIRD